MEAGWHGGGFSDGGVGGEFVSDGGVQQGPAETCSGTSFSLKSIYTVALRSVRLLLINLTKLCNDYTM